MEKIRKLTADEIEVRVADVRGPWKEGENGSVSLLLYKTSRVDMDILDETFGAENWTDKYERIGEQLFCTISVFLDGRWVAKQDCGIESKQTDDNKYKAEASDAFKRAGFKWGIGRELYSAPFISLSVPVKYDGMKKKYLLTEPWKKYKVWDIGYNELGKIALLQIADEKSHIVFSFGNAAAAKKEQPKEEPKPEADFVEETIGEPTEPKAEESQRPTCTDCGAALTEKVYNYAIEKYGNALCYSCQKKASLRKLKAKEVIDCPF